MPAIRTSESHPLEIATVQGSPDQGRIGITFCPGKHDLHARRLFASMDDTRLRNAVERVVLLAEAAVETTILQAGGTPKLADKLIARKGSMARWLQQSRQ